MMNNKFEINFCPCKWEEISDMVADYFTANRITVDSFWEDHVMESKHYKMICGEATVGFFSIHNNSTIVIFNVLPQFASMSQQLFARVKKYECVTKAMVATGDEFFLSHCIDDFAKIEKQAYFSIYTDKEIPQCKKLDLQLRLADINKDEKLLKLSGDFLDDEIKNIRNGIDELKIYIAELDNNIVGFGVVQCGRVLKNNASIGMFVCEEHRGKGVGANILQSLKHIVQQKGYNAFSGCWYYNHNSKKCMESAGAYSKTRLINFYF